MYKYVTLNGDVYVRTEPTFWTKERSVRAIMAVGVLVSLAGIMTKGMSWIKKH